MIAIAQPMLGLEEEEAIRRVLASGQLAQGRYVAEFEERFAQMCQTREAVAVSSGTAALHLALLAHNIGPGDEVITTPFSFTATANVILLVGATPVFVDIDPLTFNLDVEQVEAAITPCTRALLPVHLYGYPCTMPRFLELASAHHLALIEDACQAHAASIAGQSVGSFGTGCFSFYATKNMTTGEGGMITTNDSQLARRLRQLRSHGQKERYCHQTLGLNARLSEMQAAVGLVQLEKLEGLTQRRIANADFFNQHLPALLPVPNVAPGYRHVYHQYTIRVPDSWNRDEWASHLQRKGIATGIHYPSLICQQPFYQQSPHLWRLANPAGGQGLPMARHAVKEVLSLPVHPGLTSVDLETIVQEVRILCA